MSFSSLLGQYASQKAQPPQEKVARDPVSYQTLKNIESRIRRSQGAVSDSVAKDSNLCILFIIIDDFPLEHVWRLWLKNASDELHKVDVFFHAKHPDRVRSSWVRDRLVEQFHYSPSWGSVDIAKVMLFMLKEVSEKCPHVNKFVFASESCIPIQTLEATLTSIYSSSASSSWVNWHDKSQCNGYSVGPQFEVMTASFPPEYIFKADQWCLLSRYHVEQILNLREAFDEEHKKLTNHNRGFTHMFTPGKATDELIIPCSLALLGHIKGKNTDSSNSNSDAVGRVLVRRSTYCDWSAREKRPQSFVPTAQHLVPESYLQAAKAEGCIFLRKIALEGKLNETVLKQWLSMVYGASGVDERLQNALSTIEAFQSEDSASQLKDVSHLVRIFNNYERNINTDGTSESRGARPQGRWEAGSRGGDGDHKRKYEDGPRDHPDQRYRQNRPYHSDNHGGGPREHPDQRYRSYHSDNHDYRR